MNVNRPCHAVLVFGHTSMSCPLSFPPALFEHQSAGHYPCSYCRDVIEIRWRERRAAA